MGKVEALLRLATSDDWSERVHAGVELSLFAGPDTIDHVLVELLLDY